MLDKVKIKKKYFIFILSECFAYKLFTHTRAMSAARQKAKLLKPYPIQVRFVWMNSDLKTKQPITSTHVPRCFREPVEHMVHKETTLLMVMHEFAEAKCVNHMTAFDIERNGVRAWTRGDVASPAHIKLGTNCKTLTISILPLRVRFIRDGEITENVMFKECMRTCDLSIMEFMKHVALPEYKKRFLPSGMALAEIKVSGQAFTEDRVAVIRNPTKARIDDYQMLNLRITQRPIQDMHPTTTTRASTADPTQPLLHDCIAVQTLAESPKTLSHDDSAIATQQTNMSGVLPLTSPAPPAHRAKSAISFHGIDIADLFAHVARLIQVAKQEDTVTSNDQLVQRVQEQLLHYSWTENK